MTLKHSANTVLYFTSDDFTEARRFSDMSQVLSNESYPKLRLLCDIGEVPWCVDAQVKMWKAAFIPTHT